MKHPILAVDAIVLYENGIVLIKRKNSPFKGMYALPGGIVEYGEKVEDAIKREVKEETGLNFKIRGILGVYSDPKRDPRGHYISIVFFGDGKGKLRSGSDASSVEVIKKIPRKLAFDHKRILKEFFKKFNKGSFLIKDR